MRREYNYPVFLQGADKRPDTATTQRVKARRRLLQSRHEFLNARETTKQPEATNGRIPRAPHSRQASRFGKIQIVTQRVCMQVKRETQADRVRAHHGASSQHGFSSAGIAQFAQSAQMAVVIVLVSKLSNIVVTWNEKGSVRGHHNHRHASLLVGHRAPKLLPYGKNHDVCVQRPGTTASG